MFQQVAVVALAERAQGVTFIPRGFVVLHRRSIADIEQVAPLIPVSDSDAHQVPSLEARFSVFLK